MRREIVQVGVYFFSKNFFYGCSFCLCTITLVLDVEPSSEIWTPESRKEYLAVIHFDRRSCVLLGTDLI